MTISKITHYGLVQLALIFRKRLIIFAKKTAIRRITDHPWNTLRENIICAIFQFFLFVTIHLRVCAVCVIKAIFADRFGHFVLPFFVRMVQYICYINDSGLWWKHENLITKHCQNTKVKMKQFIIWFGILYKRKF